MAPIGNTSWVCDPRWESYALEQAERLKSQKGCAISILFVTLKQEFCLSFEPISYYVIFKYGRLKLSKCQNLILKYLSIHPLFQPYNESLKNHRL